MNYIVGECVLHADEKFVIYSFLFLFCNFYFWEKKANLIVLKQIIRVTTNQEKLIWSET